jgi:hypothetical protein
MKNIHLLPTPNPSRLFYFGNSSVLTLNKYPALFRAFERSTQYVYITTNSEDINENDRIITKDGRLVQVSYLLSKDLEGASKVILTTDQDLIADGVQAVTDEFLEWFIKNQICEEVGVEGHIYKGQDETEYKIIFPKEEPKKVLTEEDIFNQRDVDAVADYINKETSKEEQKKHLIDMMALDEKLGLYEDGSPGYNKQAELVKKLANELKPENEKLFVAEEVKQIAEWSFHFYKTNDLSDSELEAEWERLLNERLNKK